MTRTNYVFIDFENVPETDLDRIGGKPVHVTMVLGEQHKSLPVALVIKLLKYSAQVSLVETGRGGKNALDMVLAMYVGSRRDTDPQGFFHIIAKDRDYQALIGHLKDNGLRAAQHPSLAKVPVLMNQSERLKLLQEGYKSGRLSQPRNRTGLQSQIQSQFARTLSEQEVEDLVQSLVNEKTLELLDGNRVTFPQTNGPVVLKVVPAA